MVGPYQLQHVLGRGGTSIVWRANHTLTGQTVAIKILITERAQSARYREFFANEVRAVARLHHTHIAQVLDSGVIEKTDRDRNLFAGNPYVVTEYLAGGTLEEYRPGLNWLAIRDILRATLEALAHAHAHGVLHLDIKPGNLLLTGHNLPLVPILTDFGIAQVAESESAHDDQRVTGTPRYMAPEQITGEPADLGPWTDLYAFGCLAHRLICGRVPYDGEDATETLRAHVRAIMPEFTPIVAVPPGVKTWIHQLLAKDPTQRPSTAAQAAWYLLQVDQSPREEWLEPVGILETQDEDPKFEATVVTPILKGSLSEEGTQVYGTRPPLPINWRGHEQRFSAKRAGHVGLGMVRHRVPPFQEREPERDVLWASLHRAFRGEPQALLIRGAPGIGKTRLAEWCARLGDELGVAIPLIARFHQPHLGLGPLEEEIARHARVLHLKPEKALARFRNFLGSIRPVDEGDFLDAVAFCDALQPGYTGSSRSERLELVFRIISRIAERTPVVLVLDDAHLEPDAQRLAERLVQGARPIFCMLTEEFQDRDTQPGASSMRVLELGAFSDPHLASILQQVVRLEPHLLSLLLQRAEGVPAEAMRHLLSWVEREVLIPGVDGYELSMPRDSVARETSQDVAFAAATALLGRLDSAAREAAVFAAILGKEVRRFEWEAALKEAILPGPDRLIEEVVQIGLVARDPNGVYSFLEEDLRLSVLEISKEFLSRAEATVADTLSSLYPMTDARVIERVAGHRERAGQHEGAAELYTSAALRHHHCEESQLARRALEAFENLKNLHGAGRFPIASRTAEVARCWLEFDEGNFNLEAITKTQMKCERDGAFRAAGSAARLRAKILRKKSFEAANEAIEEAIEILERAGERVEAGTLMLSQGWNLGLQGQYEIAFPRLNEAQSIFRAEGDLHWVGKVDQAAAFLYLQRGDEVTARQRIDALIHCARVLGDRGMLSAGHAYLGEFERTRGNAEAALNHYSDVVALLGMENINGKIAMLNQAFCRIALGQFREALIILDYLQEDPTVRNASLHNHLTLGRLAAELALDEAVNWQRGWHSLLKDIRLRSGLEYDLAWLLELIAEKLKGRPHDVEREEALQLSEQIWRGLGRLDDAERVLNLIENQGPTM